MDLEDVRLVDARQPLDLHWGTTAPIAELYKAIVEAGGKVLVCPHCTAAVGLDAGSLQLGAELGTTETTVKAMRGAAKILDY